MNKTIKLILSILICQAAGILGSLFTISSVDTWYSELAKPFFSPPNWVFGPAWITLYTLMGISLYILWEKKAKLKLFFAQLIFNAAWTPIFFGLRQPVPALVEIIILWFLILLTIIQAWKKSAWAAYLLLPYIAWVSFAILLNAAIVVLN